MKRILGIDIDGVLADFNHAFINLIVKVTGRDLFPERPFDIPCWNYPEHYGYTPEENTLVWRTIEDSPAFWATLPPYPDTGDAIAYLRALKNTDLYFITSRPGHTAKKQTEAWLGSFGFWLPTVLISSMKGHCAKALKLDAYIDDRWENCVDTAPYTKTFLMDRPWNWDRNDPGIRRVFRVDGFGGYGC